MAVTQIPSKIFFCRPNCQNVNKFELQHYGRVGMLIKLWKSCESRDQKCVKMADLVNFWENSQKIADIGHACICVYVCVCVVWYVCVVHKA